MSERAVQEAVHRAEGGAAAVLPSLVLLMAMDLLCRTGYQMAKSPVLPLFAESLGSRFQTSGAIVAVSTVTGLVVSPLVGTVSDLYGRRRLLLVGTALFALMPCAYLVIDTPAQLVVVRLVHGSATGIYGPVVAAMVADLGVRHRGRAMGWYRSVRTGSYLLGPLLGGLVLTIGGFGLAWVVVGALGVLALAPALGLPPGTGAAVDVVAQRSSPRQVWRGLLQVLGNPAVLCLCVAEAALYLGLRAGRAFLPLYAASQGVNAAQVGVILSIQVVSTLLAQPLGGYLSDRVGPRVLIVAGLVMTAVSLPLMVVARRLTGIAVFSALAGLGEAAVMPAVVSMASGVVERGHNGSVLGVLDSADNVGKALGPAVAGLLLGRLGYVPSFVVVASLMVLVAGMVAGPWLRRCGP